jgi:uncharacterized protein YdeI (YjbR/CyaY-like superfamily)
MATAPLDDLRCKSRRAWFTWLAKNHGKSPGVWLVLAKAGSGQASVTYLEAVEGALAYGWIDAQKNGRSETEWAQKFVPRAKKSLWSKVNREKVEKLIDAGEMAPAVLAEIERAKADCRWDAAYDPPSRAKADPISPLSMPTQGALWETLGSGHRYSMLFRIHTVKKAETRPADRGVVAMLAREDGPSVQKRPRTRRPLAGSPTDW